MSVLIWGEESSRTLSITSPANEYDSPVSDDESSHTIKGAQTFGQLVFQKKLIFLNFEGTFSLSSLLIKLLIQYWIDHCKRSTEKMVVKAIPKESMVIISMGLGICAYGITLASSKLKNQVTYLPSSRKQVRESIHSPFKGSVSM